MTWAARIWRSVLWLFCTRLLLLWFTICLRVRVVYYHPLPKGGFIVASNHISHFDPPMIGSYFRRRIDWLGMTELFHGKILRGLFTDLGVIPIDRHGKDRTALREAVKRLKVGRVVGIFPEGGIRDSASSIVNGAKMKAGVAVLAGLSGAPILPAVILGSDRLYNARNWLPWRGGRVWIGFGEPIEAPADLAGEEKRAYLERTLAERIIATKDRLCVDFSLSEDDLPHSPQQRMREP